MCCYQRSLRFDVRRGRENKNSCCYIQPHPIRRTSVIGAVMVIVDAEDFLSPSSGKTTTTLFFCLWAEIIQCVSKQWSNLVKKHISQFRV